MQSGATTREVALWATIVSSLPLFFKSGVASSPLPDLPGTRFPLYNSPDTCQAEPGGKSDSLPAQGSPGFA
jgi:hypothetical protein